MLWVNGHLSGIQEFPLHSSLISYTLPYTLHSTQYTLPRPDIVECMLNMYVNVCIGGGSEHQQIQDMASYQSLRIETSVQQFSSIQFNSYNHYSKMERLTTHLPIYLSNHSPPLPPRPDFLQNPHHQRHTHRTQQR